MTDSGKFTTILEAISFLERTKKIEPALADEFRLAYQRFLKTKHGRARIDDLEATCNFTLDKMTKSIPPGKELLKVTGVLLVASSFDETPSTVAKIDINTDPKPKLTLWRKKYEHSLV